MLLSIQQSFVNPSSVYPLLQTADDGPGCFSVDKGESEFSTFTPTIISNLVLLQKVWVVYIIQHSWRTSSRSCLLDLQSEIV